MNIYKLFITKEHGPLESFQENHLEDQWREKETDLSEDRQEKRSRWNRSKEEKKIQTR